MRARIHKTNMGGWYEKHIRRNWNRTPGAETFDAKPHNMTRMIHKLLALYSGLDAGNNFECYSNEFRICFWNIRLTRLGRSFARLYYNILYKRAVLICKVCSIQASPYILHQMRAC